MYRRFWLLLLAVCIAAPATAQERKVRFNVGGGFTGIFGNSAEHYSHGSHFNAGVIVAITPNVSLQGEYSWNGFKGTPVSFPVSATPFSAGVPADFLVDGNMQYGDFNVLVHTGPKGRGRLQPYLVTGVGVYYRPITVSTSAQGYTTVCDPYLYYCSPNAVTVDQVTGIRSSTDFGVNFGGGIDVKLTNRASIYIETRYHYVWGMLVNSQSMPATGAPQPMSQAAHGEFLPITFGVRF